MPLLYDSMQRAYPLLLFILLPTFFTIDHALANENERGLSIEESFLEFRYKKKGDSFYRVMMDTNEKPYLNIIELFDTWFDIPIECDAARLICQATMQPSGKIYWIDGQQKQFGSSDKKEPTPIPPNTFILKENDFWLRYDLWGEWIPLNLTWSLERYSLNIQPYFLSKEDKKNIREKSRLSQMNKKSKRDKLNKLIAIAPSDPFRSEFRYSLSGTKRQDNQYDADLNYDMGLDFWDGYFQLSGNITQEIESNDYINFWRFQKINQENYHLFELGHTRFESTLLATAIDVTNGIRLEKNESGQSSGVFELRSRTNPNAEIDVIINGFLDEVVIADAEGNFEIGRKFVSGGDRVTLKYYFNDGSEDKKTIVIAPDKSLILKKNKWDINLLIGKTEIGDFKYIEGRYGLLENFSIGNHFYRIPIEKDKENESLITVDVAWRPFHNISLQLELSNGEEEIDHSLRVDIHSLNNQTMQFESLNIDPTSIFFKSSLFSYEFTQYNRLSYIVRWAPWSFTTRATQTKNADMLDLTINRRITRDLNLGVDLHYEDTQDNEKTDLSSITNLDYQWNESNSLEVTRSQKDTSSGWILRYRHVGKSMNPWSEKEYAYPWRFSFNARILDGGENNYSLSLNWNNNRYLTTSLKLENHSFSAGITLRDGASINYNHEKSKWHYQRQEWNNFSSGTLEGFIKTPPTKDEAGKTLEGITIRAAGKKAVTDKNGYYRLSGVPPYDRISVKVDENSLDASFGTVKDVDIVQFRPGTRIRLNPKLTWTAGLDGLLYTDKIIPPGISLEVKRTSDQTIMATVPIESDGFFLVEGLTPNHYSLRVIGIENPPKIKTIEIPPGTDWVSEIHIDWRSQEYLDKTKKDEK
ncbi:hypothetical protein A9Q81_06300 [Gammaproteobacteria bacterium 42_54_T18]|nr:hypothetical protein A9Q81_06300 [Gammaproteobacteria bacterium 42_54_T18]